MLEGRPFTSWNSTCLNRSYELLQVLLHCERKSMLQGRSFSEISGFQIGWTFGEFVQICCFVNVVLQNLALPMDWISGLKGLVVQSAYRWPGVGLVLGCLQCVVSKPTQRETHKAWHWTPGANASWFLGCMTARRCAKVLAGGSQW